MKKFVFAAIILSVTLTSCLSFFPNRYEKSLIYNGFRANMTTMIGTKVNIKGYYSLVTDSNISTSKGDFSVVDNGRASTLAGYNPFILYEDGTYGNYCCPIKPLHAAIFSLNPAEIRMISSNFKFQAPLE